MRRAAHDLIPATGPRRPGEPPAGVAGFSIVADTVPPLTPNSSKEIVMRTTRAVISGAVIAATLGLALATPAAALEVGQKAPDFTLPAPGGKQVKLSELLGKGPVVVYTLIQAFTGT
jgi:hypothetical protein